MMSMVKIVMPKDLKTEDVLDSMKEHLEELKSEASELRKMGKDTVMADMLFADVLPKIKLARATYDQKDVDAVKSVMAKIRHELDIAKEGTEFDYVLERIQKACDYLREGKRSEARECYNDLKKVYGTLPEDLKKIVYSISLEIHDGISGNVPKP